MIRRTPLDHLKAMPYAVACRALLVMADSDNWETSETTRWLDPSSILAEAWHQSRLARCREKLAAGEKAPAINVVGFKLRGERRPVYQVGDGLHRTMAAREAGRPVLAKIGGYYRIDPSRYAVGRGYIWHRQTAEEPWQRAITDITPEEATALLVLGVRSC